MTMDETWLDLRAVYVGPVVDRVALRKFMSNSSSLSVGLTWMTDTFNNYAVV